MHRFFSWSAVNKECRWKLYKKNSEKKVFYNCSLGGWTKLKTNIFSNSTSLKLSFGPGHGNFLGWKVHFGTPAYCTISTLRTFFCRRPTLSTEMMAWFRPMERSRLCQMPSLNVWSKLSISTSGISLDDIRALIIRLLNLIFWPRVVWPKFGHPFQSSEIYLSKWKH